MDRCYQIQLKVYIELYYGHNRSIVVYAHSKQSAEFTIHGGGCRQSKDFVTQEVDESKYGVCGVRNIATNIK